jgi:hypothetical protein
MKPKILSCHGMSFHHPDRYILSGYYFSINCYYHYHVTDIMMTCHVMSL